MTRSSDESDDRDRRRPSPPRRSGTDGEGTEPPTGARPADSERSTEDRRSTAPRNRRAGANHWGHGKRHQKQIQCDICHRWIVDLAASKYQHENSKYCKTWWWFSKGKPWREAERLAAEDVEEFQKANSSAKTTADKPDWLIRQERIAAYMNRHTPSPSRTRDTGRKSTRPTSSKAPRPRAGDSRSRTRERAADKRRTLRRDSRDSRMSEEVPRRRDKEKEKSRKPTGYKESSKDTRKASHGQVFTQPSKTSAAKASSKGNSGTVQKAPASEEYEYYSDSEEQSKEAQSSKPATVASSKAAATPSEPSAEPGAAAGSQDAGNMATVQLVNQLLKTAIREGLRN